MFRMMILIFAIAAGCIVAERLWPAMELPWVGAWWPRVVFVSAIQLGITVVVGHDVAHLSAGMLMVHLFTFDPAWLPARRLTNGQAPALAQFAR